MAARVKMEKRLERRKGSREFEADENLEAEVLQVREAVAGKASIARVSVPLHMSVESWNAYSNAADTIGLHRSSVVELIARSAHRFRFNAIQKGDPVPDLPHIMSRTADDRTATLQASSVTLTMFARDNLDARAKELRTSMGHLLDMIAQLLPSIHLFDLISCGPLDSPSLSLAAINNDGTSEEDEIDNSEEAGGDQLPADG